jgi:tRNA (guanine-N7-)-methyltransferase
MEEIERNRYKLFCASKDVYADMDRFDEELQKKLNIKTHYENLFSSRGERIKYCQFSI